MNLDEDTVDELPARPRRTIAQADRELLELAARALGAVRVEDVDGEEWLILHFADGSIRHGWNPLLHSDDVLDLAVVLCMNIEVTGGEWVYACAAYGNCSEQAGGNKLAAVRRAIVRAAAEVGQRME